MNRVLRKEVIVPEKHSFWLTMFVFLGLCTLLTTWIMSTAVVLATSSNSVWSLVLWLLVAPLIGYFGLFHPGPGKLLDRFILRKQAELEKDLDQ